MPMPMMVETQRIDGVEYVLGSSEWRIAKAARDARFDAAFAQSDEGLALAENHVRDFQRFPGLDRLDSNQSAFLARDLVFKRAAIERTVYDENRAAEYIPIEGGHPEGAIVYETRRWNQKGVAQFSTELETANTPRADVTQEGDFNKYVNVKGSYGFTIQDMARAAFASVPLPMEKALACAEMIGRGLDQVGRSGTLLADGTNTIGLTGLFNHPDPAITTLTHGSWDVITTDEATTIANIKADFAQLEQAIIAASRDNQSKVPYVFRVPTAVEGLLQTLQLPNTTMNLKNYLIANSRLIKSIERWIKLDDAVSPVSRTTKKLGVAYPMDMRVMFWPFSVAYQELAPQLVGFEYMIYAYARCGGVEIRRPFEVAYVEHLTA